MLYYWNENYYDNVKEIIDDMDMDCFKDDDILKVELCELRPMFQIDADKLSQLVCEYFEEDFVEDFYERDSEKITEIINGSVNFEKLNSEIPNYWYPCGKFEKYTKQELLDLIK